MSLFIRGLLVVIGGAFAVAVANLFISGVPQTQAEGVDVAGLAVADTPVQADAEGRVLSDVPQPGLGEMFMNIALSVISPDTPETSAPAQAVPLAAGLETSEITALPGSLDPQPSQPIIAPLSAGRPADDAATTPLGSDFDAMAEVWRDWMQANGIETGAFAMILPDGTEFGTGMGRSADDLRPIMSLTKTITGLCVDQLLLEANLGWDTRLADIAPQMSEAGLTPRAWNENITLAELVTHTSGLAPDLTQSNMASDTHGALGLHRRWAAAALQEEAITGEAGDFFYSNTNYAVLGVVVEALSGESYGQACMDRIVTPSGISDTVIEGRYGSLSSYGGWEISAMDYARLAQHWFAPEQHHMANPRPDFDGYALGYYDDGTTIRHAGRFCQRDHPTGGVGSLFIHRRDGTVVSMNWDACTSPAVSDVLAERLLERL